jgi:hypothetical protein
MPQGGESEADPMTTLKTTVEQLGDHGVYWASGPRGLGELIHDARLAHWYRLLAWAMRNGAIHFSSPYFAYVGINDTDAGFVVTPDEDGLPIRTPELEAALRKALEEAT